MISRSHPARTPSEAAQEPSEPVSAEEHERKLDALDSVFRHVNETS